MRKIINEYTTTTLNTSFKVKRDNTSEDEIIKKIYLNAHASLLLMAASTDYIQNLCLAWPAVASLTSRKFI